LIGRPKEADVLELYRTLKTVETYWDTFKDQLMSVNTVEIDRDLPYYGQYLGGGKLILNSLYAATIAHELAHGHHRTHPKRKELERDWQNVAGIQYGIWANPDNEREWRDKTKGPRYGIIEPTGSKSLSEDIAVYCQLNYALVAHLRDSRRPWKPLLGYRGFLREFDGFVVEGTTELLNISGGNPKYEKKLYILLKYGFISEREHELIKPAYYRAYA